MFGFGCCSVEVGNEGVSVEMGVRQGGQQKVQIGIRPSAPRGRAGGRWAQVTDFRVRQIGPSGRWQGSRTTAGQAMAQAQVPLRPRRHNCLFPPAASLNISPKLVH